MLLWDPINVPVPSISISISIPIFTKQFLSASLPTNSTAYSRPAPSVTGCLYRQVLLLMAHLKTRTTGRFSAHCVETSGGRCACSAVRSALSVVTTVRTTFRSSLQITSKLPTPTAVRRRYNAPEPCWARSRQKGTPCVTMSLIFCWRAVGVHYRLIPK